MNTRTKVILAGAAGLALGILLLPRLARRIDSIVDPLFEKAAVVETQYREMTNAYPISATKIPAPSVPRWAVDKVARSGLPVRDTADCQSALRAWRRLPVCCIARLATGFVHRRAVPRSPERNRVAFSPSNC